MRYKIFSIEADMFVGGSDRTVTLQNIFINPAHIQIKSEPERIDYRTNYVCMSEEHSMFNFDILNYPVMDLGAVDNIFDMDSYSAIITNTIEQEFPQVYRDYGGRVSWR